MDSSRTRGSGGSGIGLTISRHLVWAMGGELTAVSPGTGQGSTFTFTLPLARLLPSP
ncbi:MAG: ATP-binding protein [Chloroflexi bacterium]|nr:ATP-binding protein [Chloroflexota bacterium]